MRDAERNVIPQQEFNGCPEPVIEFSPQGGLSASSPAGHPPFAMDRGYIKLWRKTKEWVFFRDAIALQLWILLLLDATHKPMKKFFKGQEIELMPGQIITGRKYLFAQTGIPETTIERWLKRFEKCGQIGQQTDTRNRLITIIDWETYQGKVDNKRTTNGQQTDTNKNVRMEELKNKDILPSTTVSGVVTKAVKGKTPLQQVMDEYLTIKKIAKDVWGVQYRMHCKCVSTCLKSLGLPTMAENVEKFIAEIKLAEKFYAAKKLNWTIETVAKNFGHHQDREMIYQEF